MKRLLLHTVFFVVEVATVALSVSPTSEPPLPASSVAGSGVPSSVAPSSSQLPSPTVSPTPGLTPVYEDPVVTYGDNRCEKYVAGGHCESILSVFPGIVSNHSREHNQYAAGAIANQFIDALVAFNASEICLQLAVPLLCRWTIPTCDPAFVVPTYQPLCRYDCEIIRDFVCKRPWEKMLELLHLLNVPDRPDCSPLNNTEAGNAPMCVGSIRTGAVPLPQRTGSSCYSGTGRGYNGSVSVTSSGIPCQPWNSSYPHQYLLYLEGFEELEGGHNYCRNPGNRGDRPWCFTTDRGVRWEYCNVPRCDNGAVCEPYSLQVEHGLCRTTATIGMDLLFINTSIADQVQYDDKMVDIQLAIAEYSEECRNMFFEYVCVSNFPQCDPSHSSPRPNLPCRRFCREIASRCEGIRAFRALGGLVSYSPLQIEFNCDNLPEASGGEAPECYLPVSLPALVGNETCYEPSNNGLDYVGTVNITESGHTCQSWTAQMPHPHTMTPVLRPYLDKHNYCRNPEGRGTKPWCYTTDPQVRWEYCDIPVCGFIAVTPDYESGLPTSPTTGLMPSPTPGLTPVYEDPVVTYGDNRCEKYVAGGHCEAILSVFPGIVSNYSREHNQYAAGAVADQFVDALVSFNASEICLQLAVPLVCRWTIPTCDPAFVVPTYQPLCRYDCEIIRDFVCKQPWERMLELLHLLNAPDQPDCSPLNNTEAGNAPMCVGSIRTGAVPLPQRTGPSCYSGTGRGYNGSVSVTSSGIPCQPWNSSYPHQHLLYLEGFEELEGGHNYCRNPGNRGDRPWCFTTDRVVRWEYCNVPRCDNGTVCEPYSLQVEHGLCRTTATIGMDLLFINTSIADQVQYDDKMVDIQLAIAEYSEECRNMFFEYVCVSNFPQCDPSHSSPRPTLPCRRFCRDIASRCTEDIRAFRALGDLVSYSPLQIEFNCDNLPEANGGEAPECYLPVSLPALVGNETCYEPSNKGLDYIGRVSVTESGHTCQSWTAQMPHPHTMTPVLRPYLDKHNYCRNPEGRGTKPWCYTTDPQVRWEYCDIPVCGFIAVTPDYEQPEEEITNIPTWAIIVITAVCVLLLLIAVLVFCIFLIRKMSKEQKAPVAYSDPRYTEGPVRFVGKKEMLEEEEKTATSNPLYTRNSQLHPEQSLEYEGVKLPEYPRSNIIYVRDLGQGHFGVVVQAEARNIEEGKEVSVVAIKVLKEGATPQIKKEFFREASLMCAFDHPNILKLLGVCIEMEPLCMIFEYMELGDLNNFLRKKSPNNWGSSTSLTHSGHLKPGQPGLTTQQLVFISVDVATGLEYLAQNHYVHRDLATRNCLVSGELRVKISDFGLSQDIYSKDYFRLGDSELLPIRWMPPEAILYAKFTTQSDVWSFGIVLWEIFSFGMQPYFSLTNEEVVAHVRDGNVLNCPDRCPQEIYDLMLDCWAMNPSERPTAAEINMGLRRWTPDLSASLQMQTHVQPDYQNMAVVREYATTQLSCHSTSGRTLNDSKCSMGEGKFEMAPANNARPDAIGHDHSFVATTPPPEESWVPTVAYSSCSGEDSAHVVGGSTHVVDDQQETTVL